MTHPMPPVNWSHPFPDDYTLRLWDADTQEFLWSSPEIPGQPSLYAYLCSRDQAGGWGTLATLDDGHGRRLWVGRMRVVNGQVEAVLEAEFVKAFTQPSSPLFEYVGDGPVIAPQFTAAVGKFTIIDDGPADD
ncbi:MULTISPECIES: hypothetical protein [unclassified Mycobacterium]|uniref:hypothetical protein n=1 Tax=unclassified Mycobacterium TaxID=2642494 RepID=UPI0029C95490|nr:MULTISPECIES: hypothetical protein [unclassified Mycobacterium]